MRSMARQLSMDQRGRIAEKLMDLGNIGVAALIFGQAISDIAFDLRLAVVGLVMLVILYVAALVLMRR